MIEVFKGPKTYQVQLDGTLQSFDLAKADEISIYGAHDNFYIHSGQEEFISYNTIAPDGRIIEVNRFIAINKNPGIRSTNGRKG